MIRPVRLVIVVFLVGLALAACETAPRLRAHAPEPGDCALSPRDSLAELLTKVRECMITSRTGWLRGYGWVPTLFESVPFVRNPLDTVETTGPIALLADDGRAYWVNQVALNVVGITDETPDPPYGKIGRKPGTLVPNGFLYGNAMDFVDRTIPHRIHVPASYPRAVR